MKIFTTLLLLSCFIGAFAEKEDLTFPSRELLKSSSASSSSHASSDSTSGSASSTSSAKSTEGRAEAVASATSKAFQHVSNQLVEYFDYVFQHVKKKSFFESKEDYCERALAVIEKKLDAVGEVVASAYTEALGSVQIQGKGRACSSAQSAAESQATGFAKILAEAIADASIRKTKASASADVEASISVLAQAFSEAFADACLQDEGSAVAMQTSFGKAVTRPVASVSVYVAAGVDCKEAEGFSLSKVEAGADVTGEEVESVSESTTQTEGIATAETTGSADASTDIIDVCTDAYKYCCYGHRESPCICSFFKSSPKCYAVLRAGSVPYWEDKEKSIKCRCDGGFFSRSVVRVVQ